MVYLRPWLRRLASMVYWCSFVVVAIVWGFIMGSIILVLWIWDCTVFALAIIAFRRPRALDWSYSDLAGLLNLARDLAESTLDHLRALAARLLLSRQLRPLEEPAVAKDESRDAEMLITVDDVLLDDDLLRTTMRPVLMSGEHSPRAAINFVIEVLTHRLPHTRFSIDTVDPPDLRGLHPRVWHAAVEIIGDVLRRYSDGRTEWSDPDISAVCTSVSILQSGRHTLGNSTIPVQIHATMTELASKPEMRQQLVSSHVARIGSIQDVWRLFNAGLRAHRGDRGSLATAIIHARCCGDRHDSVAACEKHASSWDVVLALSPSHGQRLQFATIVHELLLFAVYFADTAPDATLAPDNGSLPCFEALLTWAVRDGAGDGSSIELYARLLRWFRWIPQAAIRNLKTPSVLQQLEPLMLFGRAELLEVVVDSLVTHVKGTTGKCVRA